MKQYFCIIGAQRSGSTYLSKVLDAHPEIYMAKPIKPEPKFFINDEEYRKGRSFYIDKYFTDIDINKKVIGEKSTSYIEFNISKRIKEYFPQAKILAILRNPVDRAISNYFFSLNNGLEERTLKEVFVEKKSTPETSIDNISVSPFSYLERGFYSKFLTPYIEEFENNMKVLIFEEFVENQEEFHELFEYLGVDGHLKINLDEQIVNAGDYNLNDDILEVKNLLNDHYSKEISRIEEILDRKLPVWKNEQ